MEEIGSILPSIFSRHIRRGDSRLVEILTPLWSRAVGRVIARHSRPVSFVSGTLTLAAACPSWAAQLGQMSEEVRAEINSFLGRPVVRKLRVRHVPTLVLENGNSQLEAGSPRLQTPESEVAGAPSKPALQLASLDPEIARFVEDAFAKYFSTAVNPRLARRGR